MHPGVHLGALATRHRPHSGWAPCDASHTRCPHHNFPTPHTTTSRHPILPSPSPAPPPKASPTPPHPPTPAASPTHHDGDAGDEEAEVVLEVGPVPGGALHNKGVPPVGRRGPGEGRGGQAAVSGGGGAGAGGGVGVAAEDLARVAGRQGMGSSSGRTSSSSSSTTCPPHTHTGPRKEAPAGRGSPAAGVWGVRGHPLTRTEPSWPSRPPSLPRGPAPRSRWHSAPASAAAGSPPSAPPRSWRPPPGAPAPAAAPPAASRSSPGRRPPCCCRCPPRCCCCCRRCCC